MVGILIVTHGCLGKVLAETAGSILDTPADSLIAVSVAADDCAKTLREKIRTAIRAADRKHGILILTDMFGGAASDMSYSFLEKGKIDVISAVNLPILLKALKMREHMCLRDLARCLTAYGKQNISLASDILSGKRREQKSVCPFIKKDADAVIPYNEIRLCG